MTETWVSNSAVESGGMGWRGGVVDGIGVVGASGEHIYAGRQTVHTHTYTKTTTTEISTQVGNNTNSTDPKGKKNKTKANKRNISKHTQLEA